MKRALIKLCVIAAAIILLPVFSLAGTATISWNANTDEDLAGYRIYYGNTKGGPYGSSTSLIPKTQTSYTITNLSTGSFYFVVTAVDTSDNESPYSTEAFKTISAAETTSPATSVTLMSNLYSPQKVGAIVTFTATASGGSGTYEYQFWRKPSGGSWSIVQNYSSSNSFSWNTTGAAGTSQIVVWARNAGASVNYDVYKSTAFVINALPKASSVTLSANRASPQKAGTTVTFTAKASGGTGYYEYKFLRKKPGGSWYVAQDYSSKNTFTWSTKGAAGTNYITVYARTSGRSAKYDTYKWITYVIK